MHSYQLIVVQSTLGGAIIGKRFRSSTPEVLLYNPGRLRMAVCCGRTSAVPRRAVDAYCVLDPLEPDWLGHAGFSMWFHEIHHRCPYR